LYTNPSAVVHYSGTVRYLAPEVLRRIPYDPMKCDIWALGIVFYEMCKGLLSWPDGANIGDSIASSGIFFPERLPPKLHHLVLLMTRVNPSQRPSIREVIMDGGIQAMIADVERATAEKQPPLLRVGSNLPAGRPILEPLLKEPETARARPRPTLKGPAAIVARPKVARRSIESLAVNVIP
jgi:serine/threonine protein kinase